MSITDGQVDISAEFLPLYNPANRKFGYYSAKPNFVAKQNLRLKFGLSPTFRAKLLMFKFDARCVTSQTRSSADADNRLDAFSGQSRSTNMVPFHMLYIVSYCAIVTLPLRRAVFTIFVFKKFHDLEMGSKVTQGH